MTTGKKWKEIRLLLDILYRAGGCVIHSPHNCHIRKDETTTIFFFFQRKGNDIDGNVEKGKISNIRERERESLSIQQQLYAAVKRERRRNNENEIYGCYTVNKASYVVRPRLFLIHTCTVYILTLFEVVRMCIRRESHFHPRTNHFLRFFATFIVSRWLSLSRKYAWKELLNSRLFRYHSIDTAGIENGRHVCCAGWTGEMMVWTYPNALSIM